MEIPGITSSRHEWCTQPVSNPHAALGAVTHGAPLAWSVHDPRRRIMLGRSTQRDFLGESYMHTSMSDFSWCAHIVAVEGSDKSPRKLKLCNRTPSSNPTSINGNLLGEGREVARIEMAAEALHLGPRGRSMIGPARVRLGSFGVIDRLQWRPCCWVLREAGERRTAYVQGY